MYPGHWSMETPEKPAVVMAGSGEVVTYRELDDRSNRLAQLMYAAGLRRGDHIAIFMENHPRYFEVVWAGFRSGLYVTTVNRYLTGDEAGYIVDNCEARVLVTSAELREPAAELVADTPNVEIRLMVDGTADGYESYEEAIERYPAEPLAQQPMGGLMLYSSGTTGRPKGITRPLPDGDVDQPGPFDALLSMVFQFDQDSIYLSPAPLYHSAPLGFTTGTQTLGGTVVMMEKFDPIEALALIEKYSITHSQWVPTMFTRMLKRPVEEREQFDLSSHRVAIHAAAPCPVGVKQAMIDWWGPILHEYYGGTELNGLTYCNSEQWLAHPGTVGAPVLGTLHICAEDGTELPPGESGLVYFELPEMPFEYFKDNSKTRGAQHPDHPNWSALGDVGYLDEDGFLFLTDRATFMIISGGVNIYPQEIEDVLIQHPGVLDVAVIGVPNEDMGEEVKAVVQPVDGVEPDDLPNSVLAYAREHLAGYKVPRSVDLIDELPRLPTGKLYKRLLRDQYWGRDGSRIV
jgi:long-chain acyl-CoA synthetase